MRSIADSIQLKSAVFGTQVASSRSEELRFRALWPLSMVGAVIGRVSEVAVANFALDPLVTLS